MTPGSEHPPERHEIRIVEGVSLGPGSFVVVAGPCAVESAEQLRVVSRAVRGAGAAMLRGGAFKPRTAPSSFQGLGEEGLRMLAAAREDTGLPIVTEVLDPRQVELVAEYANVLQVGSRNMQNVPLLREVGRIGLPVLLKRGAAATIDELLHAADYVRGEGNEDVILCERGLRSFDASTRYLLDLAAVPNLRSRSGLPVFVDPSHATGRRDLVIPMARAALAAGADGILVEVHPDPATALSDGPQALTLDDFSLAMDEIRRWIPPSGRYLAAVGQALAP